MRSFLAVIVFFLFFSIQAVFAQAFQDPWRYPETNSLMGGVGVTWIDNTSYTTFTIAPDIAFGKIGIGLYLQLLFNNEDNFKLRTDEFKDAPGILRTITYVRYGQKYDPFYARLGMLYNTSLANGFLMWNYNNGSNYDKRKLGLVADFDFGKIGVETVYSNFSKFEIAGGNLYFRPFRFMPAPPLILRNLRLYGTFIHDDNIFTIDSLGNGTTTQLQAYGFGTDLQWLNLPVLKSFLYAEYGKFIDYGSGKTFGISAIVPEFIGLFGVGARFEKRFLNEGFISNFFGPLHELNRNLPVLDTLASAPKTEGWFGELSGHVLHRLLLVGNYQSLNGIANSGRLHLEASAPDLIPNVLLRAYYDKSGIETFEDARTLDNRSIATGELGYQIFPLTYLTIVYRWYWVEEQDEFGNISYKPLERIEPRISFSKSF
ncbi:MAG: hypothetical protein ACE5GL_04975 [Calditrichia bacterium]